LDHANEEKQLIATHSSSYLHTILCGKVAHEVLSTIMQNKANFVFRIAYCGI
jgi:hypothetical protein